MTIEELIAKAKKLGIEFDSEDITEEEVQSMIDVAEAQKKVAENAQNNQDAAYLKSELDKAILKRDDIKKERRKLIAKNKDLEEQIRGLPNADEIKVLQEELTQLKEFKTEIDLKDEKAREAKMDEVQRLKNTHEKAIAEKEAEVTAEKERLATAQKEEESERSDLQKQIKELRIARLEAEIIKVAATKNAWSPDQVARLVRDDFQYDDDLQKFVHTIRDSKGKITADKDIDEYVSEYLDKEENENLVRSKANNSTLHAEQEGSDIRTGSRKATKKTKSFDPKDPEIVEAAEIDGMEVQRYIDVVLVPMEKALHKGDNNETE